jgi:hypothetical protein
VSRLPLFSSSSKRSVVPTPSPKPPGVLGFLFGIYKAINEACAKNHLKIEEIDLIRINEATPVIGDVAMETSPNS